jgi:hypothetical protein
MSSKYKIYDPSTIALTSSSTADQIENCLTHTVHAESIPLDDVNTLLSVIDPHVQAVLLGRANLPRSTQVAILEWCCVNETIANLLAIILQYLADAELHQGQINSQAVEGIATLTAIGEHGLVPISYNCLPTFYSALAMN